MFGVAKVTIGENVHMLDAGKSVYIPLGSKHRLENETNERMELIEVQLGTYLGRMISSVMKICMVDKKVLSIN